jgi:hypothetical protein
VTDCITSVDWHLSGVGDVGLGSTFEDGGEIVVQNDDGSAAESGLVELESILKQCRESLLKFESKERFVGIRIQRYRELLERRRECCRDTIEKTMSDSEQDQLFVNSESQVQTKQKYNEEERTLRSVEKVHKNLIAEMEVLRRRISDLEEKRLNCIRMREECREFVLAAAVDGC